MFFFFRIYTLKIKYPKTVKIHTKFHQTSVRFKVGLPRLALLTFGITGEVYFILSFKFIVWMASFLIFNKVQVNGNFFQPKYRRHVVKAQDLTVKRSECPEHDKSFRRADILRTTWSILVRLIVISKNFRCVTNRGKLCWCACYWDRKGS